MLLKKEEINNEVNVLYDSSNILSSKFNKITNDLIITFKNGGQYRYKSVTSTDYTRFELAESQGNVFNSHIKKYELEKLNRIDSSIILKEIISYKENENKELIRFNLEKLINRMKYLISLNDNKKDITEKSIEMLNGDINDYLKYYSKKS